MMFKESVYIHFIGLVDAYIKWLHCAGFVLRNIYKSRPVFAKQLLCATYFWAQCKLRKKKFIYNPKNDRLLKTQIYLSLIHVFMVVSLHHVFGWNATSHFNLFTFYLQDSFATLFHEKYEDLIEQFHLHK